MTMQREQGGRARVREGIASSALLLVLASCLAVVPGTEAQNNFFGVSDDLATPPTVRPTRARSRPVDDLNALLL